MPSLSNAPVTVRLIVVPIEAASAWRKVPALKFEDTTLEAEAATDAALAAAAETPPPEIVPPVEPLVEVVPEEPLVENEVPPGVVPLNPAAPVEVEVPIFGK